MAKKSIIAREKRKTRTVERFSAKRARIKDAFKKADSFEEQMQAAMALQKLPRNASPSRGVQRCMMETCGRPKGVFRKFGLCRIHLREALMRGDVTGGRKSSW